MPAFIIHAMGKEPQKAINEGDEITAGRDPDNDLVLPGDTVSRHHAAFVKEPDGPWRVVCMSETNAIVVDGTLVETESELSDGTEILLGAEILLVFSGTLAHADQYMASRSVHGKSECASCGWKGMLSALHVAAVCPACGGNKINRFDLYDRGEARREALDGRTEAVRTTQIRAHGQRIKEGQRSRIERIDDQRGTPAKMLTEARRITIGKKAGAALDLKGLTIGEGLQVWWNGACYMIESELSFPAMKINGERRKKARMHDGDQIEVGKNRFRFFTG